MKENVQKFDVVVLGGGPAGLAAAISAHNEGARVLLIERENRLGGILKQCIHDGFGLIYFKERLTGPEYAGRFIEDFFKRDIEYYTNAFLIEARRSAQSGYELLLQSARGMIFVNAKTIILACGCRERTSRQVFIHGERPAGVFTAGTAQYLVNIMGKMPVKRCVILGSGDIGLIMARRFTLEGAEVEGVYEIKDSPAGLARNISQCLDDFDIPLHLSSTVTRVFGSKRVEAVEVCKVDKNFNPIESTKRTVPCDALILSVGLLPENEIAESLSIDIDPATKGPVVDQTLMTNLPGVFCCGNALHVNDLVDYVSQSGTSAGIAAAGFALSERELVPVTYDKNDFLYALPQYYDKTKGGDLTLYFRSRDDVKKRKVEVFADGKLLKGKKYSRIVPGEMEVLNFDPEKEDFTGITVVMSPYG